MRITEATTHNLAGDQYSLRSGHSAYHQSSLPLSFQGTRSAALLETFPSHRTPSSTLTASPYTLCHTPYWNQWRQPKSHPPAKPPWSDPTESAKQFDHCSALSNNIIQVCTPKVCAAWHAVHRVVQSRTGRCLSKMFIGALFSAVHVLLDSSIHGCDKTLFQWISARACMAYNVGIYIVCVHGAWVSLKCVYIQYIYTYILYTHVQYNFECMDVLIYQVCVCVCVCVCGCVCVGVGVCSAGHFRFLTPWSGWHFSKIASQRAQFGVCRVDP